MLVVAVDDLLDKARSFLQVYDEAGFRRYLNSHWSVEELSRVLGAGDAEAAKVAATALGIQGAVEASEALLQALRHEDPVVCAMAEFALWTIWYREAGADAEDLLRRTHHLDHAQASIILERMVDAHPEWAEAHHQSGIVNFKAQRFVSALDDFRQALAINKHHFGAKAGLGHVYAQLGMYHQAEEHYLQALQIHPHMGGIRQALQTVRGMQNKTSSC